MLYHYQDAKKISSIYQLILAIQQILGSWKVPPIFSHTQSKITEVTFGFSEFESACKKSLFHRFITEIKPILESCNLSGHTHFWHCPTKKKISQLLNFINLYQHAKKLQVKYKLSLWKKIEKIHQNVLKNFKNPTFGPIFHFFQKSGSVTHDFIWVSNTWLTFRKN